MLGGSMRFNYRILDDDYKVTNRALGTLGVVGSSVETVAGAGLMLTAETGIGAVASVALTAHGLDNLQASWRMMTAGDPVGPYGLQALQAGGDALGVDPRITTGVYVTGSIATGFASSAITASRAASGSYTLRRSPVYFDYSPGQLNAGVPIGARSPLFLPVEEIGGYRVGSYGEVGSHHIIQGAAVQDVVGYSRRVAPSVDLGAINDPLATHALTRPAQMRAGGGTYSAERRIAYRALRDAGIPQTPAREMIGVADQYFESIGVTRQTPLRIPGDRPNGR
jgi:hypothetical protein